MDILEFYELPTWWSSAMLEPLRKVAGPLTKALVLGSYFCKTFVMISLVLLDLYDTLQFWVFIGEGWGGNDPLNKICEDTFQQYPGDMYSHVMAKFGENRSLESWRNVIWFWRQKKLASWDASELPVLMSQSWSHTITCVFQLVGSTSHSVFVVRNVCIPVNVFYTCIEQMSSNGV